MSGKIDSMMKAEAALKAIKEAPDDSFLPASIMGPREGIEALVGSPVGKMTVVHLPYGGRGKTVIPAPDLNVGETVEALTEDQISLPRRNRTTIIINTPDH